MALDPNEEYFVTGSDEGDIKVRRGREGEIGIEGGREREARRRTVPRQVFVIFGSV